MSRSGIRAALFNDDFHKEGDWFAAKIRFCKLKLSIPIICINNSPQKVCQDVAGIRQEILFIQSLTEGYMPVIPIEGRLNLLQNTILNQTFDVIKIKPEAYFGCIASNLY